MNLTIYRGTNQICGNCIELEHNNTRILLDFGIPLEAMDMKNCKIEDFKTYYQKQICIRRFENLYQKV